MRIWLLFLIANVFATSTLVAATFSTIFNWVTGVDTKVKELHKEVTFWCAKPHQNGLKRVYLYDSDVTKKLDFSKPINLVVHGWLSGLLEGSGHVPDENVVNQKYSNSWMRQTAIDWANFGDCNACIVDWSRLATFDYSTAASQNIKLVAQHIVNFVLFLNQNGMNIDQMSIAGHSLGAQIAGHVGTTFQGKIAAIYGLDPAGPGFTLPIDFGTKERLNPTDAKYVQCIYTNNGVLGTNIPCGQGNFVMNGGLAQPGCLTPACAHSRATEYFTESLNPSHRFVGEECESVAKKLFLELIAQPCSNKRDQLGIYSARSRGVYFVKTNSSPPYFRSGWRSTGK